MWTGRILLLLTFLLTAGGWFDDLFARPKKAALLIALPALLAISFVPTLRTPSVRLCFAPCAFALITALLCPTDHPFGALVSAALGGLVGWKLCDALPLFPEQGVLIALPTAMLAALYCRDANAKALAVAAAPFFMLLMQAIGDYTLFHSAVLELGSGDALCAQAIGSGLLLAGGCAWERLRSIRIRKCASALPIRKM